MRYEVDFNKDVAKVSNRDGKVLQEVSRTCPFCGKMCDFDLTKRTLTRKCKKCDKEWHYEVYNALRRR